jgi:hypothetical protein
VHRVLDQVRLSQVKLDVKGLVLTFQHALENIAVHLWQRPDDLAALLKLEDLARIAKSLSADVDVWKVQNIYFALLESHYPRQVAAAAAGDIIAESWVGSFTRLADELAVSIPR